jgi:predicted HAD superfamily Cof-like phosphohydrolase
MIKQSSAYEEALKLLDQTQGMSPEGVNIKMLALQVKALEEGFKGVRSHPNISQDIVDFHTKFAQTYKDNARTLPPDLQAFRSKFLKEELEEYLTAAKEGKIIEQVDGLVDLVYVAVGTLYLMGVDFNKVWEEVHNSNMSKSLVPKGEGKHGYTVHKGETYVKPQLHKFV